MVHTAMLLLRWLSGPLPIDSAGTLVRSIYLRGGVDEACRRALLDVAMRRHCGPEVSIAEAQQLVSQLSPDGTPRPHSCRILEGILRSSVRQYDSRPKSPSAWSRQFTEVLQNAGLPGERTLDSADYQTWQAWLELLKSFGTLDVAWPLLSCRNAIEHLARCTEREVFEPENIGAPVQVLGPLEASGSRFDYLWVMGLDDETWPARASANPLLPPLLQRRYGMPHAYAADDLEFARRVTGRLRSSAIEVVFSCPRMDGERALRPSPLLADLLQRELQEVLLQSPATWVGELSGSADVETLSYVSPLQYQHEDARGGSRVFQLQAACPFRAFAELRLGAEEMETPVPGLDASERGQLVHLVLQYVWEQLDSQSELRALSPDNLRQLVASCVDEAVRRQKLGSDGPWSSRFVEIERERLTTIVCAWLELEKARAPFRVVEREQKKELEIGGVRVSVRVDRIDELEMGGRVVLDYKTGAPKGNIESAWDGERPDEPQLPLYAITEEAELAGLAFAYVRAGENRFRGQSDALGVFPGVKPLVDQTLRDKVNEWRVSLAALGEQFLAGMVVVDPKKAVTCRWCSSGPLCRRYETSSTSAVMEDGDASDL
jgi:probable DNA repair protein